MPAGGASAPTRLSDGGGVEDEDAGGEQPDERSHESPRDGAGEHVGGVAKSGSVATSVLRVVLGN